MIGFESLDPDAVFTALLGHVRYRSYSRSEWAALALLPGFGETGEAEILGGSSSRSRSERRRHLQQMLLACADAARRSAGQEEALALLCAAHAVVPLKAERLWELNRLLLPLMQPQTQPSSSPLPPSGRWQSPLIPPLAEWIDVPTHLLISAEGSHPPPPDLQIAAEHRLREWREWALGNVASDHGLIREEAKRVGLLAEATLEFCSAAGRGAARGT